jgi:trehalose/maltose hydrolase-like predicted phosphorylase
LVHHRRRIDVESVKSSESLFSIGNGAMGQRANFEEKLHWRNIPGSYIAGIYYLIKPKWVSGKRISGIFHKVLKFKLD